MLLHTISNLHSPTAPNRAFRNPPYPPLRLDHQIPLYNAMHLARTASAYIAPDLHHLNDVQLAALENFHAWLKSKDLNQDTRAIPGDVLLPAREMRQLWTWANDIFFAGDLNRYIFHWDTTRPSHPRHIPGLAVTCPIKHQYIVRQCHIVMEAAPCAARNDANENSVRSFVGILLHEAVHAFLATYACDVCKTYEEDVGVVDGHGRAFQVVAKVCGKRGLRGTWCCRVLT